MGRGSNMGIAVEIFGDGGGKTQPLADKYVITL